MEASETTPLSFSNSSSSYPSSISAAAESSEESDTEDHHNNNGEISEEDILGRKLIACNNNEELECLVIRRSLDISFHPPPGSAKRKAPRLPGMTRFSLSKRTRKEDQSLFQKMIAMVSLALLGLLVIFVLLEVSSIVIGPPSEPIGPYKLVEVQVRREINNVTTKTNHNAKNSQFPNVSNIVFILSIKVGDDFFNHYIFYNGLDSEGSKGYVSYVSKDQALELNIANVTWEDADPSIYYGDSNDTMEDSTMKTHNDSLKEPFVYMSTSPTDAGPRSSVRLEGLRRFNRGLFILDVRHMPAGCATWPAFWLTDVSFDMFV
jgi:hypothetical protein